MLFYIPVELRTEQLAVKVFERILECSPAFEDNDPDKYVDSIMDDSFILWGYENIFIVGKPYTNYYREKCLELDTATIEGKFTGSFKEALSQIEKEAKLSDIDKIIIRGREGWRKVYPDYKHFMTTLYKEL